jgi:hypothetical protein
VRLAKPVVRARYEFAEAETPGLGGEIERFLARADLMRSTGAEPAGSGSATL